MCKNTAVGILAHVDAGKTTLSEQILYRCGALRSPGRVDNGSAFLDYSGIERRRGVTVFSDQADFQIDGRPFTLVDTPGHADFAGETERALSVLDCAVLVVSAAEGVQAHTELLWGLLRNRHVPTLVFLNKTDRAGADPENALRQLQALGGGFCPLPGNLADNGFSPAARETMAGLDDSLLEAWLSENWDRALWLRKARELTADCRLFPVFSGSALKGEGVEALLSGLRLLAPEPPGKADAPFRGLVYKVRHDSKGGRIVFLKVEQGILRPRDLIEVGGGIPGGEPEREKCGELRRVSGAKSEPLREAGPGVLCAASGLRIPKPGAHIGAGAGTAEPFSLRPLLSSKVIFDQGETPAPVMLQRFRELEDEEPLLAVAWSEQSQELQVQVMGEIQLEVLEEVVRERWGTKISFAPCSVLYRETLAAPVVGVGHFEPLRHYAEVHLLLSPGSPGSGITFRSECSQDELAASWQSLIRTHVLEKQHLGVLTGSPLTDVEITLLSGRAHLKHTEGGDFREATYRAVRQGLMTGKSILLEPWYEFQAETALDEAGKVQADLIRLEAVCEAPWEEGGRMRLHGRGPVRTLMDYPKAFAALTRGRGRLSLRFGGYEACRDQEQIAAELGYEPERDLENTPDSVFCSHGAGYPVKWSEAPAHMHLPIEKIQG